MSFGRWLRYRRLDAAGHDVLISNGIIAPSPIVDAVACASLKRKEVGRVRAVRSMRAMKSGTRRKCHIERTYLIILP